MTRIYISIQKFPIIFRHGIFFENSKDDTGLSNKNPKLENDAFSDPKSGPGPQNDALSGHTTYI